MIKNLWIIIPVYNEEASVFLVLKEWIEELEKSKLKYSICIINDGSTDNTPNILNNLKAKFDNIILVNKDNSGHGQTCIYGYKLALENKADWIFQIDSDGQCDPRYFSKFVSVSDKYKCIFGKRKTRDDGILRLVISRFVSIFTLFATKSWISDPNVPYRLIHCDVLRDVINKIPNDFYLANIYLSVVCNRKSKIKWIPIHFRQRYGGAASVKTYSFIKNGFKLFRQLKDAEKL